MKVNIVINSGADASWIAGRLARELVTGLPKYGIDAQINRADDFDLEYQQIVYGRPQTRPAVGMFTHGYGRAADHAHFYDGHITLNERMARTLSAMGKSPVVIEQALDEQFLQEKTVVFGVAGHTQRDGRKGEALVAKMVEHGYEVRGWGTGWPCPIFTDQFQHMAAFYRGLDYYVVTSSDEGGCTPILEAMAMHKPVISPRIGFAIPRPVIEYEAGNWESLHGVLRYLTQRRTYDDWCHEHADYFKQVLA